MDHRTFRGATAAVRAPVHTRWLVSVLLLGLLALLTACDASDDDAGSSGATIPPETGALECETAGYPCALSDVPEEIFIRSDMLSEEALDRIAAGDSTEEAAAWLGEQEGMAEVESDDEAIRFRLEGGRGTWIFRRSTLATRGALAPRSASDGGPGPPTRRFDAPGPGPEPPSQVADHVVGPDDPAKRALVLSPMLWDFRATDDGAQVTAILEGTRGYDGRVEYQQNTNTYDTDVDIEDFTGWSRYDVVHVASHGARLCKPDTPGRCRAVIAAKAIRGPRPDGSEYAEGFQETFKARGLSLVTIEGPEAPSGLGQQCGGRNARFLDCTRVKLLLLTADFFRGQSGLEDTFVFFNACQTFGAQGTDLADVLRGSTSVYLGWTESVDTVVAYEAAIDLYTDLAKGYPLRTAYDRLGPVTVEPVDSRLVFGQRPAGGDLRIRDVVTLLDPDSGAPLSAGAAVTIRGELDDGEPDSMPYRVWVDGITDDVAGDARLHISVDGEEIEPLELDGSNAVDEARRELEGEFDLGEDLKEARNADIRAWIDLPFGGQSEQARRVQLVGPGPASGDTWTVDIEYSSMPRIDGVDPIETSAHVIFGLRPSRHINPERVEYEVIGGTVTHDQSHEDRLCIVEAPVITAELTPEIAPGSGLDVDTTSNPWRVSFTVYVDLPDYTVTVACLPGTGEDAGPRRDPVEHPYAGSFHLLTIVTSDGVTIDPGATSVSGQDGDATFTLARVEYPGAP